MTLQDLIIVGRQKGFVSQAELAAYKPGSEETGFVWDAVCELDNHGIDVEPLDQRYRATPSQWCEAGNYPDMRRLTTQATESDWNACTSLGVLEEMLSFHYHCHGYRDTKRKRWLFAIHQSRILAKVLDKPGVDKVLDLLEERVDGQITRADFEQACRLYVSQHLRASEQTGNFSELSASSFVQWLSERGNPNVVCQILENWIGNGYCLAGKAHEQTQAEFVKLCHIFRDLFRSPFATSILQEEWLAWQGGLIKTEAIALYHANDCKSLIELGTLLEAAGCDDSDILTHCRLGNHYRGCWLLELILGMDSVNQDLLFLP